MSPWDQSDGAFRWETGVAAKHAFEAIGAPPERADLGAAHIGGGNPSETVSYVVPYRVQNAGWSPDQQIRNARSTAANGAGGRQLIPTTQRAAEVQLGAPYSGQQVTPATSMPAVGSGGGGAMTTVPQQPAADLARTVPSDTPAGFVAWLKAKGPLGLPHGALLGGAVVAAVLVTVAVHRWHR